MSKISLHALHKIKTAQADGQEDSSFPGSEDKDIINKLSHYKQNIITNRKRTNNKSKLQLNHSLGTVSNKLLDSVKINSKKVAFETKKSLQVENGSLGFIETLHKQ